MSFDNAGRFEIGRYDESSVVSIPLPLFLIETRGEVTSSQLVVEHFHDERHKKVDSLFQSRCQQWVSGRELLWQLCNGFHGIVDCQKCRSGERHS